MKSFKHLLVLLSFLTTSLMAAPAINKPAPNFTGLSDAGKTVSLSQFKGKTVVLEWKNHLCPFVKKHYNSQNMQTLQKTYTQKGVVWISVISSAKDKQGFVTPQESQAIVKKEGSSATVVILDSSGEMGRLYEAKTTPFMVVINPAGDIVYQGAIDDNPSTDSADIPQSQSYVKAALDAVLAGKTPAVQQTRSYGCSVKY